ncbi:hypothetical protein N7492_006573 [Penicillium capsulatum]|uniref:Beta-glucuronidase C-terminal domain-containing protein n=1 Tax=Penicillium capsulatum TaxID=69766 RepID=A0A9W9I0Q4_9EURO|nr:hypothetical protein N7492_006573 [Penicillium capsulatum]KAJ6116408.1 hypothetical protein N7512_006133 [Penicillium capsulatum]
MLVPLLFAAVAAAVPSDPDTSPITVSKDTPRSAGAAVLHPFLTVTGDLALYDPNLTTSVNGTFVPAVSGDFPYYLSIGPSFFESYATLPNTKFIHGFNLGKNDTAAMKSLLATIPLACKALKDGKLAHWELGNEPDLFKTTKPYSVRPANWNESDYVHDWRAKERIIKRKLTQSCPELAEGSSYSYIGPSFAGLEYSLDAVKTWRSGLNSDHNIALNSMHNYIGGAEEPGVTLRRTLMNHTSTVDSVAQHVNLSRALSAEGLADVPYILGETNSLYHQGKPGLSNSFGAALWGVDFNLYCASQSIRRVHMHQGTDYRYAAWQPVDTNKTTLGTKPPYYGNIMVAAMLRGNGAEGRDGEVRVVHLAMPRETEAAYAAYVDGRLARIAVVNLQQFNSTGATDRPTTRYRFQVPPSSTPALSLQRLLANGSDALSGISWDGWSYNYELKDGAPVRLRNVTVGETVAVDPRGVVELEMPWSSAAILNL